MYLENYLFNETPINSVIVVGAGAAGLSAAISAARSGAEVYLLEKRSNLGGTVTHSLIHTIGGLYDSNGNNLNEGLSIELTERLIRSSHLTRKRKIGKTWVLSVTPEIYGAETKKWISEYPNLHVLTETQIIQIVHDSNRITSVLCKNKLHKSFEIKAKAIIDATGSADFVRAVNPNLIENNLAQVSAGMVLVLRGTSKGALDFPKGTQLLMQIREGIKNKLLPTLCARAWLDQGSQEDEVYLKLTVPHTDLKHFLNGGLPEFFDVTYAGKILASFLRQFNDFKESYISQIGEIGMRDNGGIRGEYRLTITDLRTGAKFKDSACKCNWPIEYWDSEKGVSLEYLPLGQNYEIPMRALKVVSIENLWAAGKCLSAEPLARASARVVGTCWAMGEAVGREAALFNPTKSLTSSANFF